MSAGSLEIFARQIKIYLYTPIPILVNRIWVCYRLHLVTCQKRPESPNYSTHSELITGMIFLIIVALG